MKNTNLPQEANYLYKIAALAIVWLKYSVLLQIIKCRNKNDSVLSILTGSHTHKRVVVVVIPLSFLLLTLGALLTHTKSPCFCPFPRFANLAGEVTPWRSLPIQNTHYFSLNLWSGPHQRLLAYKLLYLNGNNTRNCNGMRDNYRYINYLPLMEYSGVKFWHLQNY